MVKVNINIHTVGGLCRFANKGRVVRGSVVQQELSTMVRTQSRAISKVKDLMRVCT